MSDDAIGLRAVLARLRKLDERGRLPDDTDYTYGALARAEALKAGEPEWWKVTKWPPT
jgi:hypothetical protein